MRLEFKEGKSNKFWEAELGKTWVTVTFGRVGSAGQKKRHDLDNARDAAATYQKLIAQKKKKGYREVGGEPPAPASVRDEKLEAAVRGDRERQAPYFVLSDFLQSSGEPIGELIAVQIANANKPSPELKKRSNALIKKLSLLDADMGSLEFRWGLLESVRLENTRDWMDSKFDVRPVLEKLFGSVACTALRELKVGVIRWDEHMEDLQRLFEIAARFEWAKGLERLHLGDVEDVDMTHHSIGTVGKPISKTFPALRSLILHGGQHYAEHDASLDFSGLDLPELKQLVIETCSMNKKRLKALWAAKLPKLEGLTLWFGDREDYGATATLKDLKPLLEGNVFPNLKHLGLANAGFEKELAVAVPKSTLAPQLESLDLSMGTLDDADVAGLVAAKKSFPKLKSLDVSDNWFTKAGVAALKKAYPNLEADHQRKPWEDQPDVRYVSVSE